MTDIQNIPYLSNFDTLVQFKKLHDDAIIPTRGTPHSIGFDLYAIEDVTIIGGAGHVLVKTGIAVQMPLGYFGKVEMRSGLAVKQHLAVGAGVIDIDFEGNIGVVVRCEKVIDVTSDVVKPHKYTIKKGEKFAQLVITSAFYGQHAEVTNFAREYNTHAGWGSTDKKN